MTATVTQPVAESAPNKPGKQRRRRSRRNQLLPPVWFALPALGIYLLIVIYPSLSGGVYAFTDWRGLSDQVNFVGLDNFRKVFSNRQSVGALTNVFLLTLFVVVVQNSIGLLMALGVHSKIKSRILLRTIFFAPVVVSPIVIVFLWKYLFDPRPERGINAFLGILGLDGLQQNWLGDPDVALWSVGITIVWQLSGISMVIFLAGLQGVPRELLEAAAIDGAGTFRRFQAVTLPMLAPAITINVMLSTIGGLKVFDQVFALTGGGPGYATEVPSTLLYQEAFVYGNYAYATAIALVLTIVVSAVALLQLRLLKSRETAG